MPRYIKAELAINHTVIYSDDSGKYFRFSGGTWTWRNHNPGNLVPGKVSARNNQIGTTGKFAIFPDYESGHLAIKTKGWISKQLCLISTKQGELDLHICISDRGHEYLRARAGSSVNGSLEKLVVKDPKKDQKRKSSAHSLTSKTHEEKADATC